MSYAIETKNLTKFFRKSSGGVIGRLFSRTRICVLDRVTLSVPAGTVCGLVGPNGAGKTTLMKILATLILPDSGEAFVNRVSIQNDYRVKNSIGLVTGDERSFYWRLSGRENLLFFANLYNLFGRKAKTRVDDLLKFMEIENPGQLYGKYSTGMKQRLAIARSLLSGADVLLFDEATKSLDPLAAHQFREFVRKKLVENEKKTILFATHNLHEASTVCDRIAILHRGELRAFGSLKELQGQAQSEKSDLDALFLNFVK